MHYRLSLTALAVAHIISFSSEAQVIISEYVEGSSNNKAIELVNLGTETVDLSRFRLELYANGSVTALNPAISFSGQLAPKGVHVVAHTSANAALKEKANALAALNYNGDDALVLKADGVVVDSLGRVGERPTGSWKANGVATADMTLRRKSSVTIGDTVINDSFDPSLEYDAFAIDDFSDLGLYQGAGGVTPPEPEPYPHGNCGDSVTLISAVQGSGASSPLAGTLLTVEGVVTANFSGSAGLGGFYIQQDEARYDQDGKTSEGLFVFNSLNQAVTVGNLVRISGVVEEAFGQTQLNKLEAVTVCNTVSLPAAVQIDLPMSTADQFEALEGMIVQTSKPWVVTDNSGLGRFNEVVLSSERLMTPTQVAAPGDAAKAVMAANALNKLTLDDGSNLQNIEKPYPTPGLTADNTLRTGDEVQQLKAIMGFGFSKYRLHPIEPVRIEAKNLRTETPQFKTPGDFQIASMNVLNYFNGDGQGAGFPTSRGASSAAEFSKQREKIIAAIAAMNADIVGLLEIENDGFAATSALADLVNGLNNKAAADVWAFVQPNAEKIGGDQITSAFIYRKDRVELQGVSAFTDAGVFGYGSRPPLAQVFKHKVSAESLLVVINHLKSKGGCPSDRNDVGNRDSGDGQGCWNAQRVQAVAELVSWLATNPTQFSLGSNQTVADIPTLVMGDINAYLKEDPMVALENAGYLELGQLKQNTPSYSYQFNGEFGSLDHTLGNAALQAKLADVTKWHINADEPTVLDYNEEFKSTTAQANYYAPSPYRSSDHDPILVSIRHTRPVVTAATFSISENATPGTLVGQLSTTAIRPVVKYQLSGEYAQWFSANAAGELRVAAGADPDFEKAAQVNLAVSVEQEGGLVSAVSQVQVQLKDEPELPTLTLTQRLTTMDNKVILGTDIAQFSASAVGEGATVASVTLTAPAGVSGFSIVGNQVVVSSAPTVGKHSLTLRVTDSLGKSISQSFEVDVAEKKSGALSALWLLLAGVVWFRRRQILR